MIAYNIQWDTDGKSVPNLPSEIEIPPEIMAEIMDSFADEISDYLSNLTGFCHFGFSLR